MIKQDKMALRKNNQADYNNFADTKKDVLGKEKDPPKSDTLRSQVISGYGKGELLEEGALEGHFKQNVGDASTFPQLSVQDYSEVKEDKKGKYVVKGSPRNYTTNKINKITKNRPKY
jgi:hypothetical protein